MFMFMFSSVVDLINKKKNSNNQISIYLAPNV